LWAPSRPGVCRLALAYDQSVDILRFGPIRATSERTFLAASRERAARERTARRRRIRLTVAGLSATLAVISALAVLALVQRNQALSRQLAANAEAQLPTDSELSLLLARQAFKVSRPKKPRRCYGRPRGNPGSPARSAATAVRCSALLLLLTGSG
jgi:hypothetical protein